MIRLVVRIVVSEDAVCAAPPTATCPSQWRLPPRAPRPTGSCRRPRGSSAPWHHWRGSPERLKVKARGAAVLGRLAVDPHEALRQQALHPRGEASRSMVAEPANAPSPHTHLQRARRSRGIPAQRSRDARHCREGRARARAVLQHHRVVSRELRRHGQDEALTAEHDDAVAATQDSELLDGALHVLGRDRLARLRAPLAQRIAELREGDDAAVDGPVERRRRS